MSFPSRPLASQTFASFGLSPPLLRALSEEKYEIPTPIQTQAIPPVLAGHDLLGLAQTGSGKTAAFALPIIQRLDGERRESGGRGGARHLPVVLVLSPTRELAAQIDESFATYGRHTRVTHTVIFGGVNQSRQVSALRRGVEVLVATPGRLLDLMGQGYVSLNGVKVFVLDEADRMLDMGFIQPIRRIAASLPQRRQTLLFSATMPPEIEQLTKSLLHDPVRVAVAASAATTPQIEQSVYMVPRRSKQALLEHLLEDKRIVRALVFTRTKRGADRVTKHLKKTSISAEAIHGNKGQNQRLRALESFRLGHARVLVATDVAARGLDIDDISHVVNFDMPDVPEIYVHRIGRTARAGATGVGIAFCDAEEFDSLRAIEKLTGRRIPAITQLPALPEPEPGDEHRPRRGRGAHTSQSERHSQGARGLQARRDRGGQGRSAHKGARHAPIRSRNESKGAHPSHPSPSRPQGTKRLGGKARRIPRG
ncbi:MAG: DEAD/DEAH box helicase [Planctomycetes bacterium]|nr:DEAD/DEAH box helicase [Planctomycetota bacterium]